MADFGDIAIGALGTGSTTALVVALARKWWGDREAEREEMRKQLKASEEEKDREVLAEIKEIGSSQRRLEDAMRDVTTKTDNQAGAIREQAGALREVKTRVSRGFKFHRKEQEKMAAKLTRVELELESLKAKKR